MNIKWERIIGFVLAAVGIWFILISYKNIRGGISSESWPKTDGLVNKSTGKSGVVAMEPGVAIPYNEGRIVYEYKVGRAKFISTRISYSGSGPTKETSNKYPEGLSVSVFYNPQDPKESVLEPGLKGTVYTDLGGAILFLIVGEYFMIFGLEHFNNIEGKE